MKYVCLGYIEPGKLENMPEQERNAWIDECFTYDDVLRKNGHFAGGEGLQPPGNAVTLCFRNGKVAVTDGPYAETKEQLGGILILEANDLNHAIQLMSKHPGVRAGPFEIRPAADLAGMIRDSERRRAKNSGPGYKSNPEHRITTKPAGGRVRVTFNGEAIADSREAIRMDEGNYAAVYYIPRKDAKMERFVRTTHTTYCPFKGHASYFTLSSGGKTAENAVWSYETPYDEMGVIKELLAFYPNKVDSIVAEPS